MKITVADFFTGFFSALALRETEEEKTFRCGDQFNEALQAAYQNFARSSEQRGLHPNFLIYLDPLHGDSSVIEEGFVGGIRRDLISLDNPSFQKFRLNISSQEARNNLSCVPGGPELYKKLAEDFVSQYSSVQAV